jgi:hypothetical protein
MLGGRPSNGGDGVVQWRPQLGAFLLAVDSSAADCVAEGCPPGRSVEEIEHQVVDMSTAFESGPLPSDDGGRTLVRPLAFLGIATKSPHRRRDLVLSNVSAITTTTSTQMNRESR